MRGLLVCGVAAAALIAAISTAGAMGGMGGGGYSSPTSGGMGSMSGGPNEYSIAVRLIKHDKCGDALPHLETALESKPNSADTLNYLGYCERKIGNFEFSLQYYNKALAIDPDHKGVHEYLGELYLAMNKPDDANKELATLATLCPSGCDERDALAKAISLQALSQPTAPLPVASDNKYQQAQ